MKKLIPSALALLFAGFTANPVCAQETPTQATVMKIDGTAMVTDATRNSQVVFPGMKLAQGAVLVTGAGTQVTLQVHAGIVAVVSGKAEVEIEQLSVGADGMRNAMLNVRKGSLATSLDPANKLINNYGVRTAQGVARAHGTTMTVSVNGNSYTVSVVLGNVEVSWAGGQSISIQGNSALAVTTIANGTVTTGSLGAAMMGGDSTGLTEALTAAAAAVATVAGSSSQITNVIDVIAAAAGNGPTASTLMASVTAAAVGSAVTNPTLVTSSGGTTALAATISTAAVTATTTAGNSSATQLILTSSVNAVAKTLTGTNVNAVSTALANSSNGVAGNTTVNAGLLTAGVNAALNPATAQGSPPTTARGNTVASTPITPIDPSVFVVVSPSS